MLEKFFSKHFVLEGFRASPVGPHLDGFATWLSGQGYTFQTGASCVRHAVHLGRWMVARKANLAMLDEGTIAAFEAHLATCDCAEKSSVSQPRAAARVRAFRRYLQEIGIPPRTPVVAVEEPLLAKFITWMRQQRGASEWTVRSYARVIRGLIGRIGQDPGLYTTRSLRKAVLALAAGHGASQGAQVVTATRMFLKQLAVRGQVSPDLADGIPRPVQRSQTTLPKHLSPDAVDKIIGSCDVSSATGLRDRAILLLLARLGVRAGDVVALRIANIDWSTAAIRVLGKGRREAWLPLPQDVGDAILAYLKRGRPRIDDDHVFLTALAPRRAIGSNSTVGQVARHAILRAGVKAPSFGSHLLRHSAATALLGQGASLEGIAAILRHRSVQTTAVYARVDQRLLGGIAQPWTTTSSSSSYAPPVPTEQVKACAQPWLAEVPSC